MGNMSIRNVPDEIHQALKVRAAKNNRSAEAEVRALLVESVVAEKKGGFGTRLRACFAGVEGDELEIVRDKAPAQPLELG